MTKDIWTALPTINASGGIWEKAKPVTSLRGDFDLWMNLGERPGGMWGSIEKETLLINQRTATNIWSEVNDETLIIRPRYNLWRELHRTSHAAPDTLNIWSQIGDETLILDQTMDRAGAWSATTQAGDYTERKPARRLGWALKQLSTAGGEEYYILKNTRSGSYLRLNEKQVFLWNLMDGQHNLRDIAVAFFMEYKSLANQGILDFLGQLEANGFLTASGGDLYSSTANALGQGRFKRMWQKIMRGFTQTTFSIPGIDGFVSRLYRGGFSLLFTPIVQILVLMTALAGLVAFGYHAFMGSFSIVRGGSGGLAAGLVGLYIAQFFAILLHELAHALTCKRYGREVRRAGFMIYLGMPAFFVDTSDIWMEPRRPRMLVSWAGPYSGFFLAGLSSLLIFVIPSRVIAGLLFQFSFTCILLSFTNLNPLLRWDGYYLLMDWLEMPMLRDRALAFVRKDLWKKLFSSKPFTRDDKIYTVFGTLSLIWTVIAVSAFGLAMIDYLIGIRY